MAKKKRMGDAEELNLVPIMNLVTILIPFLLMAAQFISLAVIDSTLPAIGPPKPTEEKPDKPPLNLSIAITGKGYTILGADNVLKDKAPKPAEGDEKGPTIACTEKGCPTPDAYDVKELRRFLGLIKDEYPTDENVILVPGSKIPYEVLVVTMDATRADPDVKKDDKSRELFPYVVIAGGAE